MRRPRSHQDSSRLSGNAPSGDITAENYVQRAMAFIQARGGEGFVIRTESADGPPQDRAFAATEAKFAAWVAYLGGLGVRTTYMRRRGLATVPAEWPEDFDASAPDSDRYFVPAAAWKPARDYRPEVARLYKRLGLRLGSNLSSHAAQEGREDGV